MSLARNTWKKNKFIKKRTFVAVEASSALIMLAQFSLIKLSNNCWAFYHFLELLQLARFHARMRIQRHFLIVFVSVDVSARN